MKRIDDDATRRAKWFGPRLKEIRAARSMSQAALAKQTGMSQSTIAEYECPPAKSGGNVPSWETVLRLALALGVPVSEFAIPPTVENKSESGVDK